MGAFRSKVGGHPANRNHRHGAAVRPLPGCGASRAGLPEANAAKFAGLARRSYSFAGLRDPIHQQVGKLKPWPSDGSNGGCPTLFVKPPFFLVDSAVSERD